jgi:hypothetical protein
MTTMANGPPTPPPTSATEIQDQEKDKTLNSGPETSPDPPPQSQPRQDPYELTFPTIAHLAAEGEFHELIRVAEQTEMNVCYSFMPERGLIPTNLSFRAMTTTARLDCS